jgi:hypothetical protein
MQDIGTGESCGLILPGRGGPGLFEGASLGDRLVPCGGTLLSLPGRGPRATHAPGAGAARAGLRLVAGRAMDMVGRPAGTGLHRRAVMWEDGRTEPPQGRPLRLQDTIWGGETE